MLYKIATYHVDGTVTYEFIERDEPIPTPHEPTLEERLEAAEAALLAVMEVLTVV